MHFFRNVFIFSVLQNAFFFAYFGLFAVKQGKKEENGFWFLSINIIIKERAHAYT